MLKLFNGTSIKALISKIEIISQGGFTDFNAVSF